MRLRNLLAAVAGLMLFAFTSLAQTGSMEGDLKGLDGKPMIQAQVKIDRTDIKASYKVKTDKKGHFFHAGLPNGVYNVSVDMDGKDAPVATGVRVGSGDPTNVSWDFQKAAAAAAAAPGGQPAAGAPEPSRALTPAQKAEQEKIQKEREEAMKKNKELNDAFNAGIAAAQNKQWAEAVTNFSKASELDPKQHVVWAQLAEAETSFAGEKKGAEADAEMQKGLDAYGKAIEIKPDDPGYHNNFALALARAKKYPEAQAELTKAATLGSPQRGPLLLQSGCAAGERGSERPCRGGLQEGHRSRSELRRCAVSVWSHLAGQGIHCRRR